MDIPTGWKKCGMHKGNQMVYNPVLRVTVMFSGVVEEMETGEQHVSICAWTPLLEKQRKPTDKEVESVRKDFNLDDFEEDNSKEENELIRNLWMRPQ